jgi:hypothetical protein
LMNEMVVDILSNPENYDKKKMEDHDKCPQWWEPIGPATCVATILVCGSFNAQRLWLKTNTDTPTISKNKTRRKVGYRHMFRWLTVAQEKGVRKRLRNASKLAFRPSSQTINMGFMEE